MGVSLTANIHEFFKFNNFPKPQKFYGESNDLAF
ncbi:hypothetical protein DFQ09_10440 [Winogradskyella pacifica]|uniref:Uncharacterized protein n=1 Tax=Winogradskyella pacifica TaxID=664642 RepID=A0A3D9MW92_9FLAO|nr:hypothetical protein DFQ09_10440 [Winogradskyella pacifica]